VELGGDIFLTVQEEIGLLRKLSLDKTYLLHIQADHLTLARFLGHLKNTLKDENGEPITQSGLARYLRGLGMSITQPQISRHLAVLKLPPKFISLIEERRMSFLAGVKLSRLNSGQQEEVYQLALAEAEDESTMRVFERHIDQIRRKHITSLIPFDKLLSQKDLGDESDPTPPIPSCILDESELKTIVYQLKMRSDGETIKKSEILMFANQTEYVKNAVQTVYQAILPHLEGYKIV